MHVTDNLIIPRIDNSNRDHQSEKPGCVQLQLLGSMALNHRAVTIPRKARALLAYTAVSIQPRPRHELIELFCANSDDPRRTLRTLLSHIRRASPNLLTTVHGQIALVEAVWVDSQAFAEAVKPDVLTPATLALYRGEFMAGEALPDCPEYEMWLLGRRVHYKSLYEQALLTLSRTHLQQGETETARSHAMQLVQSNPYLEEGHALLIQILAAGGWPAEASDHCDHFCALLERELGVAPTAQFRQMVAAALPAPSAGTDARRQAARPLPAVPSPTQAPLLFCPHRLQQRLGDAAGAAQWTALYEWAMATADTASALWAYQDSAAALETALVAAERMDAPPAQQATILGRRLLLGHDIGEPLPVQQQRLTRAEQLLSAPPRTVSPPILELARAAVLYHTGKYSLAIEAAAAAAEKLDEAGDYRLAGYALTVQGQALLRTSRNAAAARILRQARPWLAAAGDAEALGLNIGETAWAAINLGRIEDAFTIVDSGLEELGPSLPPAAEARLCYTLAACWNYYYDADGMAHTARQAIARYEQIGNQALAARCEIYLLQAARYRLQVGAAQRRLGQLFQKAQRYHDTWLSAWVMALLGQSAFRQGRLDEAERWYSQAYGLRQQTGERQNQIYDLAWTGRLRAAQGQIESALHYTTTAVCQMEQAAGSYFAWEAWDMYLAHAEVLVQNGQAEEALSTLALAYRTLQSFAQRIPSPALRQQVLGFEHSRHLVTAWRNQHITPFHQRHHQLI